MLADKLAEMMASFSDNRDSHYRAQLAALQADLNLIMKADPYANKPLEDRGEESAELITHIMGNNVPSAPSAGTDYIAQCGKHYSRFVDAVNDAMEERDYNLTMLWVRPLRSSYMYLQCANLFFLTEQARKYQERNRECAFLQSPDRRGGVQAASCHSSRTTHCKHTDTHSQAQARERAARSLR